MSLVHLRLCNICDDEKSARYVVKSPDFSEKRTWETIGKVTIDKSEGSYEFKCLGAWIAESVVPPHIYGLPATVLEVRLKNEFKDFGYGAWTAKIHRRVQRAIDTGQYPAEI